MPRIRIAALVLLVLIALATAVAFAATPPPRSAVEPPLDPATAAQGDWRADDGPGHRFHRGDRPGMGERRLAFRAANNPSASVLRDLVALERMYRRTGRDKDVPALYRDVLAKTDDPVVRHMAGGRLARLEWQNGDKDAAIEQMRRNLDADIKRLK